MSLIYIVEDDYNMQEIETYALQDSGYTVIAFNCAKTFYEKMAIEQPDLIVLDITLPDENGFEILKKLRESPKTSKISVMIVTGKISESDKVKGFELGADDYMTKPIGVLELIYRVKAILRRNQNIENKNILMVNHIYLDSEKRIVYVHDKLCKLTFKEYNLLKLLMINSNIVLSRTEIMKQIWGDDFVCRSRTLDMHINTLRRKLGDMGCKIKTVRHVGYILEN